MYRLKGFLNFPHHIGMEGKELAFDDAVGYTQQGKWIAAQLNHIAMTSIRTLIPRVTHPTL